MSEEYSSKKAVLGVNNFVEFEEDSLTLDIPMAGAEVSGGWRITPMFHPTVYSYIGVHNYLNFYFQLRSKIIGYQEAC